jgi:hypothetical protein
VAGRESITFFQRCEASFRAQPRCELREGRPIVNPFSLEVTVVPWPPKGPSRLAMGSYHFARMATQLVDAWIGNYRKPNSLNVWIGMPRPRGRVTSGPAKSVTLILHFLLSPEMVGDLEEAYPTLERRFGRVSAQVWYLSQVVRSLWPLARNAISFWIARHLE